MKEHLKQVLDNEPNALYIQGGVCDSFVDRGLLDELGEALELMKKTGLPSGLGAHSIENPKACMKAGIQPDFFMKTYHADDYWSATPRAQRVEFLVDSRQSRQSRQHVGYQARERLARSWPQFQKPWIAFKVMAAGAIPPERAFRFAFQGGADFICAGMFDFQIAEDVAIAKQVWLKTWTERAPGWPNLGGKAGGFAKTSGGIAPGLATHSIGSRSLTRSGAPRRWAEARRGLPGASRPPPPFPARR